MRTERSKNKHLRGRIRRGLITALAAIVVFVTVYTLIIPAITWEKTLICRLDEHVHTDNCYNSRGALVCGKSEHKHTSECYDAPRGITREYYCNKSEHRHTAACYFSDGSLRCTVPEHVHTSSCRTLNSRNVSKNVQLPFGADSEHLAIPSCSCGNKGLDIGEHNDLCPRKLWFDSFASEKSAEDIYFQWDKFSDDEKTYILNYLSWRYLLSEKYNQLNALIGVDTAAEEKAEASENKVAVQIEGNVPENAKIEITENEVGLEELKKTVGKEESALIDKYWACDLSVTSDGAEWEPDGDKVKVTVTNEDFAKGYEYGLIVYHVVDEETNQYEKIYAHVSADGQITFETTGFSPYIFASFTIEYTYGGTVYSQLGLSSAKLSALFAGLGIDRAVADVTDVTFDDPSLISVSKDKSGDDWTLTSLDSFTTEQWLKVRFNDNTEILIETEDPVPYTWFNVHNVVIGVEGASASQTYRFDFDYYNENGQHIISTLWWGNGDGIEALKVATGYPCRITQVHDANLTYTNYLQLGSHPKTTDYEFYMASMDTSHQNENICFYEIGTALGVLNITKTAVNSSNPNKEYSFVVLHHTDSYKMKATEITLKSGQTATLAYYTDTIYYNNMEIFIAEMTTDTNCTTTFTVNGGTPVSPQNETLYGRIHEDIGSQYDGYKFIKIPIDASQDTKNVVCTNTYPVLRSLTVTKAVANESAGQSFNFTATIQRLSGSSWVTAETRNFSLTGGNSTTLNNIPDGYRVVLSESNSSGYTVSWNPGSTITMNSNKSVTVTNTRNVNQVTVQKRMLSFNPTSEGPFTFTVTVTDSSNNPINVTRLTQASGITASNNTLTGTISNFTSDGQTKSLTFNVPTGCKITVTEGVGSKDYKTTITGATSTSGKTATVSNVNANKTLVFTNEPPVQYSYIPVTSDGTTLTVSSTVGGTVTRTSEKVYISTSTAQNTIASAKADYEFRGWFLDAACTQPATGAVVSGNQLTPSKSGDGYYHGGTFYALFAPDPINGTELPATGGIGTNILYVTGALLVSGSVTAAYIFRRRRKEQGEA